MGSRAPDISRKNYRRSELDAAGFFGFFVPAIPAAVYALRGMATKKDPFAALEALRSSLPVGNAVSKPLTQPVVPKPPSRAVVRMERKGRGGKEVTVVDKLGLRATELEVWCKDLKQALGCGGAVDGELIVLQGDLRSRVPAVLTAKGVGKVTLG
jgi:translation initiation factor 1